MISDNFIDQMEQTGRNAVMAAGDLIRDRFGAPLCIQSKGKADYVTNVDRECQALIMEVIARDFPDHHIISEEMKDPKPPSGVTWIIDPLDGTTNFIRGFPVVAVSAAVYDKRDAILGFVLDPLHQELFTARMGNGAWLNGKPIWVRDGSPLEESIVATGFPFRTKHLINQYMTTFERIFRRVGDIRRAGSAALDLAYLAAGRVDGFWEIGLKAWDVAAGALLIREAGGYVSDFWGKENFLQNGHIVAGTDRIYAFLLEEVKANLAPSLKP